MPRKEREQASKIKKRQLKLFLHRKSPNQQTQRTHNINETIFQKIKIGEGPSFSRETILSDYSHQKENLQNIEGSTDKRKHKDKPTNLTWSLKQELQNCNQNQRSH